MSFTKFRLLAIQIILFPFEGGETYGEKVKVRENKEEIKLSL